MNAAVYARYGPPEVIEVKDVEEPVPRVSEVLIEVRGASLNPSATTRPSATASAGFP